MNDENGKDEKVVQFKPLHEVDDQLREIASSGTKPVCVCVDGKKPKRGMGIVVAVVDFTIDNPGACSLVVGVDGIIPVHMTSIIKAGLNEALDELNEGDITSLEVPDSDDGLQ